MLKRLVCWGVGLLLAAGGGLALAQTRPAQTTPPAQPAAGPQLGKEMRGKIVRVDPQTGLVTIRTGTGATAKDMQYRIGKDTKYFGTDRKALADGLRYNGFKQGADVWYRYMPANGAVVPAGTVTPGTPVPMNLNELRLGPSVATPGGTPNPGGKGAPSRPGTPPVGATR